MEGKELGGWDVISSPFWEETFMAEGGIHALYIRANLRDMTAWNPTTALPSERTGRVHRMDLNECPYPPSPGTLPVV